MEVYRMIKLDKEQYTKSEVEEFFKPYEKEITDLKALVAEGNKAVEKLKELEKGNLTNAIKLEMIKNGLDPDSMYDLIDADSIEKAQAKINKLIELKKQNKFDNSFKPGDKHKQTDEYSKHEKEGNVEGMLKSKLSNLFQ
jgi:hypothetical protein